MVRRASSGYLQRGGCNTTVMDQDMSWGTASYIPSPELPACLHTTFLHLWIYSRRQTVKNSNKLPSSFSISFTTDCFQSYCWVNKTRKHCLRNFIHTRRTIINVNVFKIELISSSGHQCSQCSGQVRVWEDVLMDGSKNQWDAGHKAAAPVLHRRVGHRWFWDIWCEFGSFCGVESPRL